MILFSWSDGAASLKLFIINIAIINSKTTAFNIIFLKIISLNLKLPENTGVSGT